MVDSGVYWKIVERNYGVYSKEEQQQIKNATITIVGVGGDGGIASYILARIGVGRIRLIDFDTVELSNLNRQCFALYSTVGEKKVKVGRKILTDINPALEIEAIDAKLNYDNAKELLANAEIILQCVDNLASRVLIHRVTNELGTTTLTQSGQPPYREIVTTFLYGRPSYEKVFNLPTIGKELTDIDKMGRSMSFEKARNSAKNGAKTEWVEDYLHGKAGWAITPERGYLSGLLLAHEAIRLIIGKKPLAVAPKAIVVDLSNPRNLIQIRNPPKGNWDYREY